MAEAAVPRLSRRDVLVGGALLGTAAAAYAATPRTAIDLLGKAKLEALIPNRIGSWSFLSKSGLVIPPADELADRIYDQLLTRVYVRDDRPPMMLLVAQSPSQDGTIQVHRPEVCYPASGYRLSDSQIHPIPVPGRAEPLPTRMFTASSNTRTEHLVYWTRIGTELPTSWAGQRLAVARANLRGLIPDAVLVRISTISDGRPDFTALFDEFARDLLAAMPPQGRLALIGP